MTIFKKFYIVWKDSTVIYDDTDYEEYSVIVCEPFNTSNNYFNDENIEICFKRLLKYINTVITRESSSAFLVKISNSISDISSGISDETIGKLHITLEKQRILCDSNESFQEVEIIFASKD